MLSLGEIDALERQLRQSIVGLNKRKVSAVTLIEAIDEAGLWPEPFEALAPIAPTADVDRLIARAPLLTCAVAAEIGFRFEGVGTEYWAKLANAFGLPISMVQRGKIGEAFESLAARYEISRPSESAFSAHFSIISWPIANALLPVDLVGPVTRLLASAPVGALPGSGRATNFPSLRAWASAAEGERLADWLRFEAPTARVLTALLTENRGYVVSEASYTRLQGAIATKPEAFFAARAARLRARTAKPIVSAEPSYGRLALARDTSGVRMFTSWPALPPALFDEALATARSAAWRPRLWGVGGFLHPSMALSAGPFALALQTTPASDDPAYPDGAEVFGAGTDAAAALAARRIDWNANLLFDPNDDRTHAEQRFEIVTATTGLVWIATKPDGAMVDGLRRLGTACGYVVHEADLSHGNHRNILAREGLLSAQTRSLLARHPFDAIGAPQGVVRPDRPFLLYKPSEEHDATPHRLAVGARIAATPGLAALTITRSPPLRGVRASSSWGSRTGSRPFAG
jgi:hypothetical protein